MIVSSPGVCLKYTTGLLLEKVTQSLLVVSPVAATKIHKGALSFPSHTFVVILRSIYPYH